MSNPNIKEIKIDAEELKREEALRAYFANFWATETGEPRAIYDRFIAASPLVDGVSIEEVATDGVHGFMVSPANPTAGAAAILFVHGGGYVQGSAKAYRGFVSQIVSRVGVPAFAIDYPLAPEHSVPAAPDAALRAWRWLADKGFDRVAIVGDSAGGGLTLVTTAQLTKQGAPPLAVVTFSPWTDLAFSGLSMTDAAVIDPLISHEYLQQCAAGVLGSRDARDPLASPLYGDFAGLPPMLIQVGTDEKLLDDSLQYARRAAAAGVSVEVEVYEGMHHVFQLDVAHIETARNALDSASRFLRAAFAS